MKKLIRLVALITIIALVTACAKKEIPDIPVKGMARFSLNGGAAISQPNVDEYNPQVMQTGDNYLVLVFASNRSCAGCTGHNLFISRSSAAYNNDAVFPAFEDPTVMTLTGTPLNYANPIAFAATLTGNNVRIFVTNAGGTVQQTAAITPGGSTDTTLTTIANTAGQTSTVLGIDATGNRLYTRQGGTVSSVNHASAGDALGQVATGHSAASITSIDPSFTNGYESFFALTDGTITSMSHYGNGGNLVSVNTAIAKAKLNARYASVMRGGGFKGGLMFVSAIEAGGTTQDLYVVDGLTVYQMWQQINPKPPGAPAGGGGGATTTADPAFSPVAGHYAMPISVTMASTTVGATICYTTDGVTDPVCNASAACTTGSTYASGVSVSYTTTNFRARACKAGLSDSAVVSATHVSDGTQPSMPGGFNTFVTMPGEIYLYWTASSDNISTASALVYEVCQSLVNGGCSTFTVSYTTTAGTLNYNVTGLPASTTYYYRVRARDEAGNTGPAAAQMSGTTFAAPTVNTPTFNPVAGTYNATQNVTISTSTSGAILCYTNDGSTPTCNATPTCTTGTQYASAVSVPATATLSAIGCKSGYTNSTVGVSAYTIDTTLPVISSVAPASSSNPTTTQVSYTLSEACASGSITWTRTGGTADAGAPYVKSLVGAELASGAHTNITLANNPTLVSGTVYSVAFNCTDAAGNAAATVTSTNVTFTNTGGSTWTARTLPSAASWTDMVYGAGTFVAIANSGTAAASSPDGITWTARTLPTSQVWTSVAYGNSTFVAVASGPTSSAASSTNGTSWTARTMPFSGYWRSVAYGGGTFVAVAGATSSAATSPDGITWTVRTMPASASWYAVTYGNGVFVATADGGTTAATSPDGITWTARTLPTSANWISVAFGNNIFVAIDVTNSSMIAATSSDGITWTQRTMPSAGNWQNVVYGNGVFIAPNYGSNVAARSTDGINWTTVTLPSTGNWRAAAYGGGLFSAATFGSTAAATSP